MVCEDVLPHRGQSMRGFANDYKGVRAGSQLQHPLWSEGASTFCLQWRGAAWLQDAREAQSSIHLTSTRSPVCMSRSNTLLHLTNSIRQVDQMDIWMQ